MRDGTLRRGASGGDDWAELEKTARNTIESSPELADSVEASPG